MQISCLDKSALSFLIKIKLRLNILILIANILYIDSYKITILYMNTARKSIKEIVNVVFFKFSEYLLITSNRKSIFLYNTAPSDLINTTY